jgi:ATP-dependent exoDNAse (exonuclease V) beta subunit
MTLEQISETLFALLSRRYDLAQFLKTYDKDAFAKFLGEKLVYSEAGPHFDGHLTQGLAKEMANAYPDNQTLKLIISGNYEKAFLTTTQTLRKKFTGIPQSYDLYPALYAQAEYFFADTQRQKTRELIIKTQAFITVANDVFQKYQQTKESQNQYDFEDLIMKTNEVLTRAYDSEALKAAISLDVRHLFIDEAQDTSPQQWQIVLHIVTLFFHLGVECTLFVVGDVKQSIYSFQGAKPWLFKTLPAVFERLISKIGGSFQHIQLTTSYRTAPSILKVVDAVFQNNQVISDYVGHTSALKSAGFVRTVDLDSPKSEEEPEYDDGQQKSNVSIDSSVIGDSYSRDGAYTNDAAATTLPGLPAKTVEDFVATTVPELVAATVADLLASQVYCPCVGRNVLPEDILILSRQRNDLSLISQHLLERNIPCAMRNSQPIAWLDLLAFVQFLVDPFDDYNLAWLLKSPFLLDCCVSEEQLFQLCYYRNGSLWAEIVPDEGGSEGEVVKGGEGGDACGEYGDACEDGEHDEVDNCGEGNKRDEETPNTQEQPSINFVQCIRDVLTQYRTSAGAIRDRDDFYLFFHRAISNVRPYMPQTCAGDEIGPSKGALPQESSVDSGSRSPQWSTDLGSGPIMDADIFDVFLDEILNFLAENTPNLSAFNDFLQNIFPQSTLSDYGVQLKTIHGAKGLQAPIVILADDSTVSLQKEKWVWFETFDVGGADDAQFQEIPAPAGVMLMPQATLIGAHHIREGALAVLLEENYRLLYVAMTRAQDGFISVGRRKKEGSWHKVISEAAEGVISEEECA